MEEILLKILLICVVSLGMILMYRGAYKQGFKHAINLYEIINEILAGQNQSNIDEAIYLLRKQQGDNCPQWEENQGDCKKVECDFCRIEQCINKLENQYGTN